MQIHALTFANGTQIRFTCYGAHLISWSPRNASEQMYLSSKSEFAPGKFIRGGVPIVFPQFSTFGPYPRHGIVRGIEWKWVNEETAVADNQVILELESDDHTLATWPHHFRARVIFEVSDKQLGVSLQIENTQETAFTFTAALHSYLHVSSLQSMRISGLKNTQYLDNCRARRLDVDRQSEIVVTEEIDRVYLNVSEDVILQDAERILKVQKTGFADTVVWNPGEKASTIADMGAGEEQQFICIEAAQVNQPISLDSGEIWLGKQILTLK